MKGRFALAASVCLFVVPAFADPITLSDAQLDAVAAGTDFSTTNLVANQPGVASHTDPDLVNPWGLAHAPSGPLWVADNGTGKSTVYNRNTGAKMSLTVTIPVPGGGTSAPTGTVFNLSDSGDFVVKANGKSGQSAFLFATEDGTIAGWNPKVSQNKAVITVNQSKQGAVFKGLTQGRVGESDRLYAADFAHNRVDIFDSQFHQVGSFTDTKLPSGFAPFNVQNLNGKLYVSFAKREAKGADDVPGVGNGFIDVFDTAGHFQHRLVSKGVLNSPWGMTIAPKNFGQFADSLLVGNFGDGKVHAFDPNTGHSLGELTMSNGKPLAIDGLWALSRGPNGSVTFSAGPNDEKNGLIGTIHPASATHVTSAKMAMTHMSGMSAMVAKGYH